jgi:hypothetical protein
MRRILVLATTAAVAFIGLSCGPAASDMFPMSVGSVWNMDVLMMAGTTVASLDTMQTGTTVTTALEKANLTSGEEVVKFKNDRTIHFKVGDSTVTGTDYWYYREDGDWILNYSTLDDSTADTVVAVNPSVGKTWHQGVGTAEIVGQEDVTVVAGTYKDAWKVKVTSTQGGYTFEMFYWYAKGTGLVKYHYEWSDQGYSMLYNQELTSADIK